MPIMLASMAESPIINVRVSSQIKSAADAYCEEHDIKIGDLLRRALCNELKQPELLSTMRGEGRPKAEKQPPKKRSRK